MSRNLLCNAAFDASLPRSYLSYAHCNPEEGRGLWGIGKAPSRRSEGAHGMPVAAGEAALHSPQCPPSITTFLRTAVLRAHTMPVSYAGVA